MDVDSALVMDIGAGNKRAFQELVEKHKKGAFRMALGLVGNRDDAFDISQEAFLRVYKSAHTFDQSQPFLPWFYTIIANLCRTWLCRRSRRDNKMVDVDDVSFLLVSEDDPCRDVRKEGDRRSLARGANAAFLRRPRNHHPAAFQKHVLR